MARIGRYRLGELLGRGSMADVYAGHDDELRREVAVKLPLPERLASDTGRRAFHREARAAALLHHPNVVELHDYSGPDAERPYLVMERLHGSSIENHRSTWGEVPEALALLIAHEVCLALEHAHGRGLLHRDVKLENVFLEPGGRVVLTDFGIAKPLREDALGATVQGLNTAAAGSPVFLAPEQITKGGVVGAHTDLFALGALLYDLLAGRAPFARKTLAATVLAIVDGELTPLAELRPDVSEDTCGYVEGCLRPHPQERPPSAAVLAASLRETLAAAGAGEYRTELAAFTADPASAAAAIDARARTQLELERDAALHRGDRATANACTAALVRRRR